MFPSYLLDASRCILDASRCLPASRSLPDASRCLQAPPGCIQGSKAKEQDSVLLERQDKEQVVSAESEFSESFSPARRVCFRKSKVQAALRWCCFAQVCAAIRGDAELCVLRIMSAQNCVCSELCVLRIIDVQNLCVPSTEYSEL